MLATAISASIVGVDGVPVQVEVDVSFGLPGLTIVGLTAIVLWHLEPTARRTVRAAIYTRISDDREGAGLGVARQEQDCRELAGRLGWEVLDSYSDNDLSAYRSITRPSYQRLMGDVEQGRVDAILAWHPDRLHRQPRELEDFIDAVRAHSVAIRTVQNGEIDLSTPDGQMMARIVGAVSRRESEHKGERTRRKHRELAEAGKRSGGGPRPFGLTADWSATVEPEAALVREAAERLLAGESLRGVALDWQRRDIKTTTGADWRGENLKQMLCAPRIAGLRSHHGTITAQGNWPALLDRGTWERLVATMCGKGGARAPTRSQYLLTRMARCGACGGPLYGKKQQDGRLVYICPPRPRGCGRIKIDHNALDAFITEALFVALDSRELAAALLARGSEGGEADAEQLKADEGALEQLARDHYVDRLIGRGEYLAARDMLGQRTEAARGRIARRAHGDPLSASVGAGEQVGAMWEGSDLAWRRALMNAVIDKVVVRAATRGLNRFDASRVVIEWRY